MKFLVAFSIVILACSGCTSFNLDELPVYLSNSSGVEIKYKQFSPKIEDGKSYPLCVYLHDTLDIATTDDFENIIKFTMDSKIPAFVIAPLCPDNKQWKDEDALIALDDVISGLCDRPDIDKSRIYLTGVGMGGEGVWYYALEFPDRISTIAPVNGGALSIRTTKDPVVPMQLADVNIWSIHYLNDRVRTPDLSKKILSSIWTQNVALSKFTESTDDSGDAYTNNKFLGWIFATRKASE